MTISELDQNEEAVRRVFPEVEIDEEDDDLWDALQLLEECQNFLGLIRRKDRQQAHLSSKDWKTLRDLQDALAEFLGQWDVTESKDEVNSNN